MSIYSNTPMRRMNSIVQLGMLGLMAAPSFAREDVQIRLIGEPRFGQGIYGYLNPRPFDGSRGWCGHKVSSSNDWFYGKPYAHPHSLVQCNAPLVARASRPTPTRACGMPTSLYIAVLTRSHPLTAPSPPPPPPGSTSAPGLPSANPMGTALRTRS
jgi:hypothetical protein